MNVQIQERIFSLRAEYDIVSDSGNFFGQKAIFSLGTHIEIRDPAGTTVVTIQTNSLFNIGYSITFADGRIFDFHLQKFWTSIRAAAHLGPAPRSSLVRLSERPPGRRPHQERLGRGQRQ
jgi:uncharacterized protein YxjI